MAPVFTEINDKALAPYLQEKIGFSEALKKAKPPLRNFLMQNTRKKDILLFLDISKKERPQTPDDIPDLVLVPAFITSEFQTAFEMGFLIFLPFLIIDFVVSSVLLAMGMMMLPPVMISLPLKVLLFILVDGWHLIIGSLVRSFY
jgi:flagellar biosynthetic protein FliP